MKTIHISLTNTKDLEQFGISVLTGERDNTMTHRLLCDLSYQGASLVAKYFDLGPNNIYQLGLLFKSNWNSMVGLVPAVSSIMLPPCMFKELVVFALVTDPEVGFVYCHDDTIWTDEGETWNRLDADWAAAYEVVKERGHGNPSDPVPAYIRETLRWRGGCKQVNQVHQMTQRA